MEDEIQKFMTDEIINLDHDIESEKSETESEEENESLYEVNKIDAKIKALKIELESRHNKMKVNEI